ncbi:poly(A) polymerase pla1 like protein [Zymoseptoria brevis]|uniref:Putative gamma-glutamylcyclotransferase n=1 Tax=Zymoseptoria brevis TaxID=1047168 RepID=A0A0F4GLE2_9PEZI|nr:poly(A) polymerase pla1 like protein [Zymoseptoria brevis]
MGDFKDTLAPPAPPLPAQKPDEKVSIALKVRSAPPGWAFEGHVSEPGWDHISPPAGKYFFYGTLQDPGILSEVLGLDSVPVLRPARIVGYELKLWGQYPALVDGPAGAVVQGSLFEVVDEDAAARLANYETKAYRPRPCSIRLENEGDEEAVDGYTFKYGGDTRELSEGSFDLEVWLMRMGRAPRRSHCE